MDQGGHNHIVLVGAGIMSATLAVLVRKLLPHIKITILERLNKVAAESSDAWNNAGTGHAAFCELNYTPMDQKGSVDLTKALRIAEQFEISKQFWAYLRERGDIKEKRPFINDLPHMSFVWGDDNLRFLGARYDAMVKYPIFEEMLYSQDAQLIENWIPLMIEGRVATDRIAATRMDIGTDVNFGALTKQMILFLESSENVDLLLELEVDDLTQLKDGSWNIEIENLSTGSRSEMTAQKVFIGAGGGTLPLLEKSDVPEGRGYGGFPVSGQFMACNNEAVINRHDAKVYGKAAMGSPPMSVPHLDTRTLDGKRSLLFGPYAGFSTKFLKEGSYLDLPLSIEMHNVWPMLAAGYHNIPLTKYLIKQVTQSEKDRFDTLQLYYPNARFEDWELKTAGQRVQIIKKDDKKGGVLKFGTELICTGDQSLAALLGASPGASTSVSIMLNVMNSMFSAEMKNSESQELLKEIIPSLGQSLIADRKLCQQTRARTTEILKLDD